MQWVKKEMVLILKQLAHEELLSEEQYLKLAQIDTDELTSSRLADIIKDTKIGQGMTFLPRKMDDLVTSLQTLLTELIETGSRAIRNDVGSVLDELLRRKGITQDRYKAIKEDNAIV